MTDLPKDPSQEEAKGENKKGEQAMPEMPLVSSVKSTDDAVVFDRMRHALDVMLQAIEDFLSK